MIYLKKKMFRGGKGGEGGGRGGGGKWMGRGGGRTRFVKHADLVLAKKLHEKGTD